MGELGGFLKIDRARRLVPRPGRARRRDFQRVPRRSGPTPSSRDAGRALHGVRRAVLPQRLPAGQPDPGLERPRLPRPLAGRDPPAARDEQLPRVHRPPVPGAVRGGVRARDQRGRRGHDQADRELDHRPRVGRGLGRRRSRRAVETGRSVAVVGAGPGRHGRRAAAAPRRPRASCCSSATRPPAASCASACRTSRSRSASSSAASSSSRAEGVEMRCGVDVGVDVTVDELRERVRRGRAGDRLARAARPAGPGPRARRRPLRDGLPLRAQPLVDAERASDARRSSRRRQARRRHRRRRHRRRLRRQLGPRGRRVGLAARAAARAARRAGPTTARRGRCGRRSSASPTRWRRRASVGRGEQDFAVDDDALRRARTGA